MLTDEDKQWVLELFNKLEARFEERLGKVEERFGERLEKVETTLLTGSHKMTSPAELRRRSRAAALAVDVDFESFSDRLKNLEGR